MRDQILLFDVYASQRFWSPGYYQTLNTVAEYLGVRLNGAGRRAWTAPVTPDDAHLDLYEMAALIAQRFREGWKP